MRLIWPKKSFITKDLYAPFIIEKDTDYYDDLRMKYGLLLKQAKNAGADEESIRIINRYKKKILDALRSYYRADIARCNAIIRNLIIDVGSNCLAVDNLNNSRAFPGSYGGEVQLFRARSGDPSCSYRAMDALHLPKKLRAKSGNYRFSIPGNPSLYLANSSYGCWIETGYPSDINFNVAPVVLDGTQRIFNLAVSIRGFWALNDFEADKVHCWLKLLMLMIATSYRIKEVSRTFKSEYIISQAVMMACKKEKYDGIAYYSKRVSDESFAICAINLALFVSYEGEYSALAKHMKADNFTNYFFFKQLQPSQKNRDYNLRSVNHGLITNIGEFDRQYSYQETEFYNFDKFLFYIWANKARGKGKESIPWGVKTK